eukprot:3959267-Pyramimonas_sp.AAC.1
MSSLESSTLPPILYGRRHICGCRALVGCDASFSCVEWILCGYSLTTGQSDTWQSEGGALVSLRLALTRLRDILTTDQSDAESVGGRGGGGCPAAALRKRELTDCDGMPTPAARAAAPM